MMEAKEHEDRVGRMGLRHRHVLEHRRGVRSDFGGDMFGVREIAGHAIAGREKVKGWRSMRLSA